MANITQPLRDEHQELYPHVEMLRLAGDAVYESLTSLAHARIEEAYNFLTRELLPHAQAEEKALYPIVQKAMGAEMATATMSRDHVEVARLTEQLGTLRVHKSQLSITFDPGHGTPARLIRPVRAGEIALCQRRGDLPALAGRKIKRR